MKIPRREGCSLVVAPCEASQSVAPIRELQPLPCLFDTLWEGGSSSGRILPSPQSEAVLLRTPPHGRTGLGLKFNNSGNVVCEPGKLVLDSKDPNSANSTP
jgi:hypothetical protein